MGPDSEWIRHEEPLHQLERNQQSGTKCGTKEFCRKTCLPATRSLVPRSVGSILSFEGLLGLWQSPPKIVRSRLFFNQLLEMLRILWHHSLWFGCVVLGTHAHSSICFGLEKHFMMRFGMGWVSAACPTNPKEAMDALIRPMIQLNSGYSATHLGADQSKEE